MMFDLDKIETLRKCKKCGKPLYTDNMIYTSNPPKSKYWCESCGRVEYLTVLYQPVGDKLRDLERYILTTNVDKENVKHHPCYQDLLRIREKLGELNIEIEVPVVEVEQ